MRPWWQAELVRWLADAGVSGRRTARLLPIPLTTVQRWRRQARSGQRPASPDLDCFLCTDAPANEEAYAYLLGMYLGDGHILRVKGKRGLYGLHIYTDRRYEGIMAECERAIRAMRPTRRIGVYRVSRPGCVLIGAYWKYWPCLFPQHGAGKKHERKIALSRWQAEVVGRHPERFLKGLIHSDGWRGINPVARGYPRYLFTNHSDDIREIFCRACDVYGIRLAPVQVEHHLRGTRSGRREARPGRWSQALSGNPG